MTSLWATAVMEGEWRETGRNVEGKWKGAVEAADIYRRRYRREADANDLSKGRKRACDMVLGDRGDGRKRTCDAIVVGDKFADVFVDVISDDIH